MINRLINKVLPEGLKEKFLLKEAGGSFTLKVVGAGLSFGVNILLARLLGVSDYGSYVYIYSWVTVLVIPVRLGFDNSLIRFIPEYKSAGNWSNLKGILSFSYKSVSTAGLSLALLITVIVSFLGEFSSSYSPSLIILGAFVIPLLSLLQITNSALRGFQKIKESLVPGMILKQLCIGGGTLLIYFLSNEILQAVDAMAVVLGATGFSLVVGAALLNKEIPKELKNIEASNKIKYWLSITLPMLFMTGMNIILNRTDLIMIGAFKGEEAAGIYGAITKIGELVVFGLQAINMVAAPLISELYHEKQKGQLQNVVKLASRSSFVLSVLVSVVLVLGGTYILALFGPEFTTGYYGLIILLVGQLFNAFSGAVSYLMTMTGHQNNAAKILAVCAVLNIGLNVILVPKMGIEGGAIATSISMICWNLAMIIYVKKILKINPTIL